MKKIGFILATLLLGVTLIASAQQRGPRENLSPEQQAARMVDRMAKQLQLDVKQQTELKTWFTNSFTQQMENRQKNRENREVLQEQFKKAQAATDAELKKVLTEDQYKRYKEIEAQRQKEREQHRGGRH